MHASQGYKSTSQAALGKEMGLEGQATCSHGNEAYTTPLTPTSTRDTWHVQHIDTTPVALLPGVPRYPRERRRRGTVKSR